MGIKRMGPPKKFISAIKNHTGINCFIETGTFLGNTTKWASKNFSKVYTIEADKTLYEKAKDNLEKYPNIEIFFDNSAEKLSKIISHIKEPAIFWLDAHYSGEGTFGKTDECPLLNEIKCLNQSPYNHIILIDDARLFLSPPPKPHKIDDWPDISTLLNELNTAKQRYIIIVDDVLIAVNKSLKQFTSTFMQQYNTLQTKKNLKIKSKIFRKILKT